MSSEGGLVDQFNKLKKEYESLSRILEGVRELIAEEEKNRSDADDRNNSVDVYHQKLSELTLHFHNQLTLIKSDFENDFNFLNKNTHLQVFFEPEYYYSFSDQPIGPVEVVDSKGKYVYARDLFSDTAKSEGVKGKTLWDVHPKDQADLRMEKVSQALKEQSILKTEAYLGQRWLAYTFRPVQDRKGEYSTVLITSVDISDKKDHEQILARKNDLLEIINFIQTQYIEGSDTRILFESILKRMLDITQCEYGFIGEVLLDEKGNPYLRTFAITDISWNREMRDFYEKYSESGFEFRNLNSLFGHVLVTKEVLISNNPDKDPRRGGLPPGHPALNSFLGYPLKLEESMIGMIGLANIPGGFSAETVNFFEPLFKACASIVNAVHIINKKNQAEARISSLLREAQSVNEELKTNEEELIQTLENSFEINRMLQESEYKLEEAQQIARMGRWEFIRKSRSFVWSKEMFEIYGLRGAESTPQPDEFNAMIMPEDRERFFQLVKYAIDHKEEYQHEMRIKRPDGAIRWIYGKGKPHLDEAGEVEKIVGIAMDVSERKFAELSLQKSEEFFKAIIQNSTDYVHLINKEGIITYASPSTERILGFSPKEVIGKHILDFFHPEDVQESQGIFEHMLENPGISNLLEIRVRHKSGKWIWIESLGTNLLENPSVSSFVTNNREITERKDALAEIDRLFIETQEMNKELQSNEEELRQTLENSIDLNRKLTENQAELKEVQSIAKLGRWEWDLVRDKIVCSEESTKALGLEKEKSITKKSFLDHIDESFTQEIENAIEELCKYGKTFKLEVKVKSTPAKWLYLIANPIFGSDGEIEKILGVTLDITERKQAEIALYKRDKLFRHLIENNSDGIALVGLSGKVEYASNSCEKILGYSVEEYMNKNQLDLIHPDFRDYVTESFRKLHLTPNAVISLTFRCRHKDGTWRWIENISKNLIEDPDIEGIVNNFRDITERKIAEEALKESERNYRNLMEQASDGIFLSDLEGNYISVNNKACQMLGYSLEELLGMNVTQVIPPDETVRIPLKTEELSQGRSILSERRMLRKDGTVFPVEISAKLLDEKVYVAFIRDISARKNAEEVIRESENKYRRLVETSNDLIWSLDVNGTVLFINRASKDILGYEPEELVGRSCYEFIAEDNKRNDIEAFKKLKAGDDRVNYESEYLHKDGKRISLLFNAVAIRNEAGEITGTTGTAANITERKKAEEAIINSRNYLDKIINSIPEPVFVKDRFHNWILLNDAVCEYMGKKREELLGKSDFDFFPKEQAEIFWEKDELVFETGVDNVNEEKLTDTNGVVHTLITKKTLYNDREWGKVLVGVMNDITSRKIIEEKLQEQNDELTKINAELDKFVYRASHDLRAPLVSVLGLINITKDEKQESKKAEYFALMEKSIHKLDNFIQSIISYSRNSRLSLKIEKIDFEQLVAETFDDLKYMDRSQQIERKVEFIGTEEFYSDIFRLKIIFNNIISNAIRYSNSRRENSFISISIEVNPQHCLLTFEDNGIGIPEGSIDRIFEMFYRASDANVGSGLGLYIVKDVVDVLKGSIKVQSVLGEGTTFVFDLPNLAGVEKAIVME